MLDGIRIPLDIIPLPSTFQHRNTRRLAFFVLESRLTRLKVGAEVSDQLLRTTISDVRSLMRGERVSRADVCLLDVVAQWRTSLMEPPSSRGGAEVYRHSHYSLHSATMRKLLRRRASSITDKLCSGPHAASALLRRGFTSKDEAGRYLGGGWKVR